MSEPAKFEPRKAFGRAARGCGLVVLTWIAFFCWTVWKVRHPG